MKKENFYAVVIILLLLLNIGTLGYLWLNKPARPQHHTPPDSPEKIIINELKLDEQQQSSFQLFKHRHRRCTDSVQRLIKETQLALFGLVKQDSMDMEKRDSLLNVIEDYESAKHMITIEHFHDIRSILKPGQKELFNEFMEDIGSRITGPGRKHHGPPPHRR